ncbi:hypothetical protein LCGC14_2335700 [marine sediment metagenome]|uniref:YopX protein domain-containing protein n=1 Tax=marine sediment metagenome TaxID=412755 RepID=A0A0F9F8K4_9ZZZZ
MYREIKFRLLLDNSIVGYLQLYEGWTQFRAVDETEWSYPCSFKWEKAEQFTGLKDKDGNDLDWWEGDIILAITEIPHIIVFDNGAFYLEENGGGRWLGNEAAQWDISCRKKVGNIHTNSELLEHQS